MQYNVFIGRFQPVHNAHIEIIRGALNAKYDEAAYPECNPNHVIICIGSAFRPRDPKNPFTAAEREQMIRGAFTIEENHRIHCVGIPDSLYNNTQWAQEIQTAVGQVVDTVENYYKNSSPGPYIRLVGHKKDESTFYLDMFPQWKFIGISNIDDLHSTTIRNYLFDEKWGDDECDVFVEMCEHTLDPAVFNWLLEFRKTEDFEYLKEEFSYVQRYKEMWAAAPYPPTFVTADAVVVQSGHVLLVKRKNAPGKGLWALPGGFINPAEKIEDAAIRELREETRLAVPAPVLRGSVKDSHVFDYPGRSLRGRTITHAYLFELNPGPLPKVKGSDDAEKAQWVPISQALNMEDQLFEDHASIIKYFVGA
jgi:bifunctional NMN adenylyltransferase/nudix hydrolase